MSRKVLPTNMQVLRPPGFPGVELELATQLPPAEIPKLAASGIEFFAIEQGSATLRYRGQRYQYKDARNLFAVHSLDDAFMGATQEPTSYRSLRLSGRTAHRLAVALGVAQLPDTETPFASKTLSPQLFNLTKHAICSFLVPHSHLERELRLLQLLRAVLGRLSTGNSERQREHCAAETIRAYIYAHPEQSLALSDLTNLTDLNAAYAAQVFKRYVGVTPSAYQRGVRVEQAKHLLVQGEDAAQIAQTLGFADQSHFIRIFRRYVYVTPGQFQRDNRV